VNARRPGLVGTIVTLGLTLARPADAMHAVDHRDVVLGYVRDAAGRPIAMAAVRSSGRRRTRARARDRRGRGVDEGVEGMRAAGGDGDAVRRGAVMDRETRDRVRAQSWRVVIGEEAALATWRKVIPLDDEALRALALALFEFVGPSRAGDA
jgi:hypothetical protein